MIKAGDGSEHYRNLRFSSFHNEKLLYGRIVGHAWNDPFREPFYAIWEYDNLIVVGYNTSWHDGPEQTQHYGYIHPEHISSISSYLKKLPQNPSQVRVFVLHHHIDHYHDPTDYRDFSALQNSSRLMELLWGNRFDLVVHGHTHLPSLTSKWQGYGNFLAVLCAGSFSAIMFPGWNGRVNNQFHLIHVDGRPSAGGAIHGHVQSWAFTSGRDWVESREEYSGIAHLEGFGVYYEVSELHAILRPTLEKAFRQSDYVEWSALLASEPRLRHIPAKQRELVLRELGQELGYNLMRFENEEPVLLRKKGAR